MRTCSKCGCKIPDNMNKCSPCYQAEVAEYNAKIAEYSNIAMPRYNEEIKIWNNLSPNEKRKRNRLAEVDSLKKYTFLALFIPWILLLIFYFNFLDEGAISLSIVIAFFGAILAIIYLLSKYAYKILGRFFRGIFISSIIGLIFGFIGFISSSLFSDSISLTNFFSEFFIDYSDPVRAGFIFVGFICGFLIGLVREVKGRNHATAAPKKPSPPAKPTR